MRALAVHAVSDPLCLYDKLYTYFLPLQKENVLSSVQLTTPCSQLLIFTAIAALLLVMHL